MQKGDILGHEFCGRVESMGPEVKNLKVGQRVVASFQIACGDCMYLQEEAVVSMRTHERKYDGIWNVRW